MGNSQHGPAGYCGCEDCYDPANDGWLGDRDDWEDDRAALHDAQLAHRKAGFKSKVSAAAFGLTGSYNDTDQIPNSYRAYRSAYAAAAKRAVHPLDDPALVSDFLDQGDAWCGAGLEYIPIAQMEPSHALNTTRFILNKARDICLVVAVSMGAGKLDKEESYPNLTRRPAQQGSNTDLTNTGGSGFPRVGVISEAAARGYLLDRQLVRALLARASEPPVDERRPWEAVARKGGEPR